LEDALDLREDRRVERGGLAGAGRDEQRAASGPPASASEKKSERATTTAGTELLAAKRDWEMAIAVSIAVVPKIRENCPTGLP